MTNPTSDFNPWEGLKAASSPAYITSRRVAESLNPQRRDLYWSIQAQGNPALVVGYDALEPPIDSLRRFRGFDVGEDRQRHLVIIALQDPMMREAFLKVCVDIISALQKVQQSQQRHALFLRLERWAYFFDSKRNGLSEEKQKGLIAELVCLQHLARKTFNSKTVLNAWTGPERAVHDFSFGQVSVEVKSNRGAGTPNITISSASQLSVNEEETLYLYVVEVNNDPMQNEENTLAKYVERTEQLFESPIDQFEFELKLTHAGYDTEDDYSGASWSIGIVRQFIVSADFPHIDESRLHPAISGITYRINLNHCVPFEVSEDSLIDALGADNARHD